MEFKLSHTGIDVVVPRNVTGGSVLDCFQHVNLILSGRGPNR